MEKGEFDALLKEEIKVITEKIAGKPDADRMIEKIVSAYKISGVNERYRVFFRENNLPFDEREKRAI
ncbi:MAG TPA: hypothetical protein VMS95_04385, partial [Candidatus Krumholzibacteriaceae bacterium]|nr:hypothetical protein [Candidatus Krumholzibacteriaceae bacterium]